VLGCFVDATTLLLVLVPILVPAASALGIDLVHFGVVVVAIITLGVLTPPFGLVLFVIASLTDVPLGEVMREIWGPVAAALAVIIFTALPLPWCCGFRESSGSCSEMK
jgi:TRAP-type C4-dicarboxylate transport system permease large subunit